MFIFVPPLITSEIQKIFAHSRKDKLTTHQFTKLYFHGLSKTAWSEKNPCFKFHNACAFTILVKFWEKNRQHLLPLFHRKNCTCKDRNALAQSFLHRTSSNKHSMFPTLTMNRKLGWNYCDKLSFVHQESLHFLKMLVSWIWLSDRPSDLIPTFSPVKKGKQSVP